MNKSERAHLKQIAKGLRDRATELDTLATEPAVVVKPGDNLASIVGDAVAGSVITIPAEFQGPTFPISKPITLRGPVGTVRATPADSLPSFFGAWDALSAPDIHFERIKTTGTDPSQNLVIAAQGTTLDGCVLIGSAKGQHRGVFANAQGVHVLRSHIANIWLDLDTQAIAGYDGMKDLLVEDCYLEASGENFIAGGDAAVSEAGIPQDLTIRNCHLAKRPEWKGQPGITTKNLIELKNAKRVLIEQCQMEYSFPGGGQQGCGIVFTVRNAETNPFSTIEDVTVRDCQVAHTGSGILILGEDYAYPSQRMARVTFERVTFSDLSSDVYGGDGRCLLIQAGPKDLALKDLTFTASGSWNSAITFVDPSKRCEGLTITGCTFPEGEYGIFGEGGLLGKPALDAFAPGYVWTNNTILRGGSGRTIPYPDGTTIQ